MIDRKPISGAVYGDALPSGEFVYSLIGRAQIVLNGQTIDAPSEMMFNRLTSVGGLKVASKTNSPGTISIFKDGGWEHTGRNSHGVQGHAWSPAGELVVIDGIGEQESQGLRFFDPSLPASIANLDVTGNTPGWVTGSPSYGPSSPLARHLGVTRLFAWTKLGEVIVGQGDIGGAVIQYRGKHYLLEPGDTQFIQFHREGSKLAIAISKLREREVVFFWLDESEITSLPLYAMSAPVEPPKPEPKPEPTKPEPKPMFEIPEEMRDQRQLVEAVRPEPYEDSYEVNAEWAKQIAISLKRLYPHIPVGLARAKGGSANRGGAEDEVPEGFTTDVIALENGVHWDFKSDGGVASWGLEDDEANYQTIKNRFWPAEKLEGFVRQPTDPQEGACDDFKPYHAEPDPKDPNARCARCSFPRKAHKIADEDDNDGQGSGEPDYEGILDAILAKIQGVVEVEVAKVTEAFRAEINALRAELDTLKFEGRNRLLGTITFTRKKE